VAESLLTQHAMLIELKNGSGQEAKMLLQARSLQSYLYLNKIRNLVPNNRRGVTPGINRQ
jgi:hypothetical protein